MKVPDTERSVRSGLVVDAGNGDASALDGPFFALITFDGGVCREVNAANHQR